MSGEFVEQIHARIGSTEESGEPPPLLFLGSDNVLQWDFFGSSRALLGYRKPWERRLHNGRRFPVSTGCSLYCSSARIRLAVNMFGHHMVEAICDRQTDWSSRKPRFGKRIEGHRKRVALAPSEAGIEGDTANMAAYRWLDDLVGERPVGVVTNHLGNDRYKRLFQHADQRELVTGPASFPGIPVDLDVAAQVLLGYRRSWSLLSRALDRGVRVAWQARDKGLVDRSMLAARAAFEAIDDVRRLR